jgi:hypothetical protein
VIRLAGLSAARIRKRSSITLAVDPVLDGEPSTRVDAQTTALAGLIITVNRDS